MIWVETINENGIKNEHEWNSVEELQKDWCSEECPCPCGDDKVLQYSINKMPQDIQDIEENKYGYRDFSSLLKTLGIKDNK